MKSLYVAATLLALAACAEEPATVNETEIAELPQPSGPPVVQQIQPDSSEPSTQPGLKWESISSGEGTALRLNNPDGSLRMSVACLADPGRLVVNVPTFSPIGSEDRFAFGVGQEPVTLVADPTRQQARPGVTGEAPIPDNFASLLRGADRLTALYGTQQIGPHMPPPAELSAMLGTACDDLRR